jgi:hypothetical protein
MLSRRSRLAADRLISEAEKKADRKKQAKSAMI